MRHFILSSIALLALFILPSVNAAVICNSTGLPVHFAIENARPYNDIDKSMTFYAYYEDLNGVAITGNNSLVNVTFSGSSYNLTYSAAKLRWEITVTSNISEDVNFSVYAQNDIFQCRNIQFTSRWRTPFYIKFQLYKETLNTTDPGHYMNDFQYVVLLDEQFKNPDDLFIQSWESGLDNSMDSLLEWTGGAPIARTPVEDRNVYFWGKYTNGQATVKLYEPSNYSVYIMNNKIEVPINQFYEFERPTTGDIEFMGNIYTKLKIYNATNISITPQGYNNSVYKISFTKWEANSYYVAMNIFTISIVLIIYFGLLALIIYLFKDSPNVGQVLGAYVLIATPIALGFIVYLR